MRRALPSGTVTFLFTDVEGSTRLLHELGAEGYAVALAEHRRVIREACAGQGGVEVDTQGDAFFFAFPTAPGALAAAAALTEALAAGPIQVRVGLHTGTPLVTDEGYVGDDVHFAARVAAAGHGGQVVLSAATATIGLSGSEPQAMSVHDLGEHRLKDIAEAVAIFQLGEGSFPPLKTISNTNLPRPASSFLGREVELAAVLARIEQGARLVTLTGPGGTGKTRLAIQAAASLVPEYKAGVFWVGFASLHDSALVTETIAQTLGAKVGLAEHVGERELLLLLDNLEHVIGCAPELASLLEVCPNLTLLVTSRELLRVRGEVEYPVPPLAEPEAVALFCQRAQLEPSAEMAELCARLDSLPLAVELAAARTKALTPAQILERIAGRLDLLEGGRDADPRQQTLRATIEWSYELLSHDEQQLFARLSVFAGGCTLEAAEEVADADLDTMQSLVEKSLLRFTEGRYWMLETIREYAGERLEEMGGRDSLYERLAADLLVLAESYDAPVFLGEQARAFDRLAREHENVRAVVVWALERRRYEPVAELVGSLWALWTSRGPIVEALGWVEQVLEGLDQLPERVELRFLVGAGEVRSFAGDLDGAVVLKEEFLAHASPGRDGYETWMIGATLADLSDLALERGDLAAARSYGERSLALRTEQGMPQARAQTSLAEVALHEGDLEDAEQRLQSAATIYEQVGNEVNYASTLHSLGEVSRRRGERERARELFGDALRRFATVGDEGGVGTCLLSLAVVANDDGRTERAGRLWGAGHALCESSGVHVFRRPGPIEAPADVTASGAAMTFDEAVEYALASID
jgi:predicted ATPase/class 3 adenylate cyclase